MRTRRADCLTRESGGFYNFELLFAGAIVMGIGSALVAWGARSETTWLVIVGLVLLGIGLAACVFDQVQFHRLRREERERHEDQSPRE